MSFHLVAPYQPVGDQKTAIAELAKGVQQAQEAQVLLGVTGSGKTFTMANVIAKLDRPTLIISHNKTLAAQLYSEFKGFFPKNAVEYFVSYYDYYQPEAYIPATGLYVAKDLAINAEIEKLRLHTLFSLLSGRRDVVVIASVSAIYGLSNPADFKGHMRRFSVGQKIRRDAFLRTLMQLLYKREVEMGKPGSFQVQGEHVALFLAHRGEAFRFSFFGEVIEAIEKIDPKDGRFLEEVTVMELFPANLFVTPPSSMEIALKEIEDELQMQLQIFEAKGALAEAQRLKERTELDLEMMRTLGYCSGIENYSRFFDRRQKGAPPYVLFDYFPKDHLTFLDESHVTIPQIKGMWSGDQSRKRQLVEHGFRLPSATDNRPLNFKEFQAILGQTIYVSATPASYELQAAHGSIVEQITRPTGLLDPTIEVVPTIHQIDHLLGVIREQIQKKARVLVITLTKKMAEKVSDYLLRLQIKCGYLHAEIKTLERIKLLEALREGALEVLVGVNLLREGIDLPEVALVAILDADKQGFLRNTRSLIQLIGRAARHPEGHVIMYGDQVTPSMAEAIQESKRRRQKQVVYNKKYGITPQKVFKSGSALKQVAAASKLAKASISVEEEKAPYGNPQAFKKWIAQQKKQMHEAANKMDYVTASRLQKKIAQAQNQNNDRSPID